jgi:PAS domain S-box-containing protein
MWMMAFAETIGLTFTPEVVKASLVLALIGVAVLVALFAYVGRRSQQVEYSLWASGWMLYATFLASQIASGFGSQDWFIVAMPAACVALAGWFMFCGNLKVMDRGVRRGVVALAAGFIVGIVLILFKYGEAFWCVMAAFGMLGVSTAQTGYLQFRGQRRSTSSILIGGGLGLWALHALAFPVVDESAALFALTEAAAAAVTLVIALGVIMAHELESAEQKYRSVLDGTTDAMFMVDLWTLKILDVNQTGARLARREAADLLGSSFLELCPDMRREGTTVLDQRKMFAAVFKPFNEFHFARADGSMVLCEGDTSLARWRSRAVVQVRVREVEPNKNVSHLVRRAEKMSTLGQLIAGVAHELNNPLAVVVGYAQLLSKRSIADEELASNLQHIVHESERAAKIVRDLLLFARPCDPQLTVVELNKLVCNVCDVRHRDFDGSGVELHQHLSPKLSRTKADPIQLEQVLNNLITNALHAMSGRKNTKALTIATQELGHFIRISITDTGCGIAPEVMEKMFDPFFTTKPPGKGTGLGLSISRSILEEHHGRLWAESQVGKGSTFHLELPVVACEAPAPAAVAPSAPATSASHSQRLLVVDDEPGLREVLGAVLESHGYVVTCAGNGLEALEHVKQNHFDLIISDMCMPEMDGERLYEALHERHPSLARRMLFVTGDTVSARSRTFLERTGRRWLTKPFNIRDVEEMVATCLGQTAGAPSSS